MNSIPKVVFSRTLPEATWGPATLVRDNVAEEVARMKARPGKDLVLFAGASLASTFMNLELVDGACSDDVAPEHFQLSFLFGLM